MKNIIYRFKYIIMKNIICMFNYIITKNDSIKIVLLLDKMCKKKLLSKELYLNFIKALILIFHLNIKHYDFYYNLFSYLLNNNNIFTNIFNKLNNIDLSYQLELNEYIIEKIIINTNNYFITNFSFEKLENKLSNLVNIINILQQLNISTELKINIYMHIIKNASDLFTIITIIKKYIGVN